MHGSIFEFLRNSALDARNFFDQGSVPPFRRNQFGGALGGPLKKNKLFLFGNYEGFRQSLALSSVSVVPDVQARQGLLPNATTGIYAPVANINPAMLPFLFFMAAAERAGTSCRRSRQRKRVFRTTSEEPIFMRISAPRVPTT